MAGGQMLDLEGEGSFGKNRPVDVALLQRMKTGALLRFACIAGALLGRANPRTQEALDTYGRALGEAFQIADDLLDVEGDAQHSARTPVRMPLPAKPLPSRCSDLKGSARLKNLITEADASLVPLARRRDVAHHRAVRR